MKIFSWSCYNVLNIRVPDLATFKTKCEAFTRKLAEGGVNHFRFFAYATWQHLGSFDEKWGPFKYLRQVDSGYHDGQTFPFWQCLAWNEEWWARFHALLVFLKKYMITLWLTAADWCSIKNMGAIKRNSYFYSCLEKFDPDQMDNDKAHKFAGGIGDPGYYFLWEAFWTRLYNEIQAVGVPFKVELMNEGNIKDEGYKPGKADEVYLAWCAHAVNFWTSHGVPKSDLISTSGRLPEKVAAMIAPGFVGAHGHCMAQDITDRIKDKKYVVGLTRTIISTDGCYKGSGPKDFEGYGSPSPAEALGLAQKVVEVEAAGIDGYGHEIEGPGTVCQTVRLPGSVPDIDRLNTDVVDAFRRGLGLLAYRFVHICKASGKIMGDYCPADQDVFTRFEAGMEPTATCDIHKAPPTPEPPTPPTPIEQSCHEKYIANRPVKKWQIGRWILCKLGIRK